MEAVCDFVVEVVLPPCFYLGWFCSFFVFSLGVVLAPIGFGTEEVGRGHRIYVLPTPFVLSKKVYGVIRIFGKILFNL